MRASLKKPSVRMRKVASVLHERIAQILQTKEIPGITGVVTVRGVEVTPDLREAKVWFTAFNQSSEVVLKVLNRRLYDIQGQLYQDVGSMRIVPKVKFYSDSSTEYAAHIEKLLEKLRDSDVTGDTHDYKRPTTDRSRA